MNAIKLVFLALTVMLITACGTVTHTTNQAEEAAYLVVKGNLENKTYSINNATQAPFPKQSDNIVRLQVPTGTISLKVFDSGSLVLNRKLFLSNNDNREIILP